MERASPLLPLPYLHYSAIVYLSARPRGGIQMFCHKFAWHNGKILGRPRPAFPGAEIIDLFCYVSHFFHFYFLGSANK